MNRRARQLLAALLGLGLLTACAGLPTSETIEPGLPVLGQPQQGVQVLPDGPEEGADAGQVVTGFLRANVGFPDDHEVARAFLTEELARQWRPTEHVVVYEGDFELVEEGSDHVVVRAQVKGTLDEMGYLTEHPVDTVHIERFEVTRVGGQWRISSFPEGFGLWLSRADFDRVYRTRAVHYLAPHRPMFVADLRWFPQLGQGAGMPTALARAQLAPVPAYLEGAVRDAIPDEVELTAAGVPVDPSTATASVDLTGVTAGGEDEQVRQMWAQLTQTLLQAPGVSRVRLQSSGRVLSVTDIEDTLDDPSELGFTTPGVTVPYALLRVRDQLTAVDPGDYLLATYQPPEGDSPPDLPQVPLRWVDLAASPSVQDLAAVSVDRTELSRWRAGNQEVLEGIGSELTAPSYDRSGGLWVAGRGTSGPRVWVVDTSTPLNRAVARPVEAEWLQEGTQVAGFHVSPDDTRAVLQLRDLMTGREWLAVTGIVRDGDGVPSALTEPEQIAPTITMVRSVQWLTAERLIVLGQRQQDAEPTPLLVPLGGWVDAMTSVEQAVGVRGAPDPEGEDALLVLTEQGRIYTPEGLTWQTWRNGDDVVVPGF